MEGFATLPRSRQLLPAAPHTIRGHRGCGRDCGYTGFCTQRLARHPAERWPRGRFGEVQAHGAPCTLHPPLTTPPSAQGQV